MKRRNFIQASSVASLGLMLKGIPVNAASALENETLQMMAAAAANCGKIIVIIQQNGGNDGLNTIFPKDQWSNLFNARQNILMDQNATLPLNNNSYASMHPAMKEMQTMYNDGKIMIVQGVSYPNPSFSHFRATDIWFTASGSDQNLSTGWLGRALDKVYPDYPTGYPNTNMPDPIAIQIGSLLPFSLQGGSINYGYNVPDPNALLNVINNVTDPAPNNDYGHELTFLRLMKDQSNVYRNTIQNAYNTAQAQSTTYPANNKLGDQLKIVAKLINGGLQTPIYIVNHPKSHDSHNNQVDVNDKTQGVHADNLQTLSQAIGAFQKDLQLMGKDKIVTGMTFSEFGRRIISNGSYGTDHGAGAPIIFFGAALNTEANSVAGTAYPIPGMIGVSPTIPANATVRDQVGMQFDFRQIYTTIMQDWLCMAGSDADTVLGNNFVKLPIFKSTPVSVIDFNSAKNEFLKVYPNPINNQTLNILFEENINSYLNIKIFNMNGSLLFSEKTQVNSNSLSLTIPVILSGMHILEVNYNNHSFYKKVVFN